MADRSVTFSSEEMLDGIVAWARIESPTTHVEGVNRMMDVVTAALRELEARVDRRPGTDGFADVVSARLPWGGDEPGVLVLMHLDTVHAVGTLAGPLPLRRDGDRMYGPGIYDMKGGAYLACHALRQLLRAGRRPRLPVQVLCIPDEEVGSPSTRPLIEREAVRHRYVLVVEPSRGGRLTTGRHAFLRYRLHVHGQPAHAGADNVKGRSAIRAMARLIEQIEGFSDFARGVTYSVGVVQGGTFVNVVPIACHAEVLCVAPTADASDEVARRMAGLAREQDGVRVEVEPGPVRPLWTAHPGTMALYARARAVANRLGFDVDHGQFGGGSDGNFTGALGIPTLDGLGVLGDGAHTHGEHLLVSSLEPRARLFAGLLETLD